MMQKDAIYEDLRLLGDTYQHMLREKPWMANLAEFYEIVKNRLLENLGANGDNAQEFLIETDNANGGELISRNGHDLAVIGINTKGTDIECTIF